MSINFLIRFKTLKITMFYYIKKIITKIIDNKKLVINFKL